MTKTKAKIENIYEDQYYSYYNKVGNQRNFDIIGKKDIDELLEELT